MTSFWVVSSSSLGGLCVENMLTFFASAVMKHISLISESLKVSGCVLELSLTFSSHKRLHSHKQERD